nr:LOW QUALITY PROTEIN: patched domain-containing protein 3-like [Lepeophtheirus salmonis]
MRELRLEFIDDSLKFIFSEVGIIVGKHPGYFVIIPLLLTALAATGFQRLHFQSDPEYLFSPSDGESHYERKVLETYFNTNYSDFEPSRSSRVGRFGKLIISSKDNGSILRMKIWEEIESLNFLIENFEVFSLKECDEVKSSMKLNFKDLCASHQGKCWRNKILDLGKHITEIESKEIKLTFPLWFDPETFQGYTFNFFFGGVILRNDSTIKSVTAVSLFYFLNSQTSKDIERGAKWEGMFLATVEAQSFSYIKVARFSSLTLEVELENNTNSVIPFFALNIGIMIAFCIITCMMTDWVKSKPLLGLFGVISAIMATLFSFGFIIYCGVPFIGINLAAPFLMLGIGIDDTFVMLGSWRRTSVHETVPARLAQTYRDAAISITITSITDMLSFWIGIITPFPSVRIFCLYTGACVAFTYLWHITFFGGCMAIAGYAEKSNRHSLTCLTVIPKSKAESKNWLYRIFCSGGISPDDPFNKKDNAENAIMVIFRDYVARAINNGYFKIFVLVFFTFYLVIAGWGVSNIQEGLERKKLARYDSYSVEFYEMEDTYFREYPYRVNVVLSGHFNYSNLQVQNDVEKLLKKLENSSFVDHVYTESWYRDFLDYVKRNKDFAELDISTEENFISTLKEVYLGSGFTHYVKDVHFSTDNKSIIASRFLIQGTKIYNTNDEKKFVQELRYVCLTSNYNVTVFHPYFIYFDQFLMVLPTTIQCITVAAFVMMFISLIFIPNPVCSLWVAFSIISIEVGVVGFMTLWGVGLDSISMINLIMCIGFSVDFSAHISYHYMSCEKSFTDKERIRDSMYALGLPIVQGAISTILGVVGLALAPSYVFITFFKMVFLVIVLGALHGLLVLPILLSIFGPSSFKKCKKERKEEIQPSTDLETLPYSTTLNENTQNSMKDYSQYQIKIPRPSTKVDKYFDTTKLHEMYTNTGYESEEIYGNDYSIKKDYLTN